MKRSVELLRWSLVLVFGAIAMCILIGMGSEFIRSGLNVHTGVVAFLFGLFAAFPANFAYFAYARRWRDLVAFPVIVLTATAWYQFIMLPQKLWPLESLIPMKPGDPGWMEGIIAAVHLLCLLFSFRFSDWVHRRLQHLVVRYIPPNPSADTPIEQAA